MTPFFGYSTFLIYFCAWAYTPKYLHHHAKIHPSLLCWLPCEDSSDVVVVLMFLLAISHLLLMFCYNLHIISHFCWMIFLFSITFVIILWCGFLMHLSQSCAIVGNIRLYPLCMLVSCLLESSLLFFAVFYGSAGIQLSSFFRVHLFVFFCPPFFRLFGWEFLFMCCPLFFTRCLPFFFWFLKFSHIHTPLIITSTFI
jgi:hypothetical protein